MNLKEQKLLSDIYTGKYFYLQLKALANQNNKSINEIESDLGYPRNALNNYRNDSMPSAVRLLEIADYFGVQPQQLMGGKEKEPLNQTMIRTFFQTLNLEQKDELFLVALEWYKTSRTQ